ncbi:hypothetical protein [Pseudomonas sp.]|uniref:hypothetical protein n=1 Tax=Pseudomonas sp. TaxID=306 RepID=UPI0028AF8788|nr:hypothetical protein [Pseudomonas sp.]
MNLPFKRVLLCAVLSATAFAAQASVGAKVAEQMQNNFDATPYYCEGGTSAAYACSGVLLRSTLPSAKYHTWHHSPNSKAKGGLSFSYLRADVPMTQLAADGRSGFTLYPLQQRPENTLDYQVICAWPTDGDSWERDRQGCGDNRQTAEVEPMCQEMGVTTALDWMTRFRQNPDYRRQCAFDLQRSGTAGGQDAFNQSLRVKQLYPEQMPFPWNEVILGTWDENLSHRLPIQSFFHIDGQSNALQQAQADQLDWWRTNGTFIPVIRIRLPQSQDERTLFSYHDSDQAVVQP